jgi:hypothetical protein
VARAALTLTLALVLPALAGCIGEAATGYVEIKTVPATLGPQAALYFNSVKLDPFKNGVAVLREPVGTVEVQIGSVGGSLALLCNVTVRKNRLTTVTVSVLSRPPRCQIG